MKFNAQKNDLKAALKAVSSTIGNGTVMAILGNVQLEVKGTTLTLSTSAIEVATVTKIAVASAKEGKCSVSAKKLSALVYSSPAMDVICEVKKEKLIIKSGKSKYELPVLIEGFPVLGQAEEKASLMLPQAKLSAILNSTKAAASKDDTRPAVCGNHLDLSDGMFTTVATDGRRLAMDAFLVDSEDSFNLSMPNRAVETLLPLLGQGTDVKLTVKGKEGEDVLTQAIFHIQPGEDSPLVDGVIFTCKLIEAKYPNYRIIIPKEIPHKLDMPREDLLDATNRSTIVCSSEERIATLKFSGMFLVIEAATDALGKGHEEVALPAALDDVAVKLNPDYLIQALAGTTEEEITLGVKDAASPITVRTGNYFSVIMPLR